MKIIRDGKEIELTPAEIEKAYRVREMEYGIMDMENTCDCLGITGLDKSDYEIMAERLIFDYDCGITENDQRENLARDYAEQERNNGRDISIE